MKYDFGVVKELKENETRVALTPDVVAMLVSNGLSVVIEKNAGVMSGFDDEDYIQTGAVIVNTAKDVWDSSKVLVKVKEPQKEEFQYFRPDLVIFSYLHLAVEEELTVELLKNKVTTIASESVEMQSGHLPLLAPMSEVAGRVAVQIGCNLLQLNNGGAGVLLSGVPGVQPGKVIIIGAGTVGCNAAQIAIGMGADVSVFDINPKKLVALDTAYGASIKTHYCNSIKLLQEIPKADLLITSVLVHSRKAPKIITEEMVKSMKKGSVIVDVAIDQGGNVETIDRITTFDNPTFEKFGILHCAIPNIPAAVPKTSSSAYAYAIYPYLKSLGEKGLIEAIKENQDLSNGVNTFNGEITNMAVAESLKKEFTQIELLVGFKLK
ncbi:MAG: alanine dehydrogenase [Candidatus Gastranaerophilales bacterium]|nr:alanine dehydrogenase [Candidatus Gastranaerophilales bacterium]